MTKHSDHIRSRVLRLLSDGKFHSGEYIGEQLDVSRAAISNHIKALNQLGLDIYSVTGKGYRLAQPLNMLNKQQISQTLSQIKEEQLNVLNVIDSTNQYIKDLAKPLTNGHVCLAEAQTAGRGRHGRKWISPYGASLYLSMHWHFSNGYTALGGLSLVVGVAVAETLKQLDIDWIKLKWPNDIYAQGKKLAGVLIEVEGSLQAGCDTTIGIGLNIALPKKVEEIGQPWIDLTHICDTPIDRNILAARLIDQLYSTLEQFEMKGLAPFLEKWAALDQYKDQPIKLLMGKQTIQGVGKGIDHTGALLLETSKGIQAFHGGEISVRPV